MSGPMKPSEIDKRTVIPEVVFEVFNDLIVRAWDGDSAVITQDEVVSRLVSTIGCDRAVIFTQHYLDVEDAYRATGWDVTYEKPGFNESGHAFYTFRKK